MPPAHQPQQCVDEVDVKQMAPPQQEQDTVIVFDWDDTLLSSSFLSQRGYRLDTPMPVAGELVDALAALAAAVCAVMEQAMAHADRVIIITNAETGWVELSAAKFLPTVVPLLKRVTVLSARSTYERLFPASPLQWKFYAFQQHLAQTLAQTCVAKNVLSFGDSHVERQAVRAVTRGAVNTRTKSVKFAERPSLDQLRREIELVHNCFQYILTHAGDLDLQLTVTVHDDNAAAASGTTTAGAATGATPTHPLSPGTADQQQPHDDAAAVMVDDDDSNDDDNRITDDELATATTMETPLKQQQQQSCGDHVPDSATLSRDAQFVTPTQHQQQGVVTDFGSASSSSMYTKTSMTSTTTSMTSTTTTTQY